jgi:hypothetical protein
MNSRSKMGLGLGLLFLAPFAAVGTGALGAAALAALRGDWKQAVALALPGAMFALLSGGFAAVLLVSHRGAREKERRKAEHPGQPWMWRAEWATGRIPANCRHSRFLAWGFAAFWNAISFPVAFLAIRDAVLRDGDRFVLFVLLFPIVGIGLIFWAVKQTLHHRKFGVPDLKLLKTPGTIGGSLAGVIVNQARLRPLDGIVVKLVCVHRITTRSGKNSSTTEHTLWETEKKLRNDAIDSSAGIPVYFEIPDTCGESRFEDPNDCVIWRVEARSREVGIDYFAQFDVPVFKTAESTGDIPSTPLPRKNPLETFIIKSDPGELAAASKVRLTETPLGGTEFHTPAGRHARFALVPAFLALLAWAGLGAAIVMKADFFLHFVAAAFGLVISAITLDIAGRSTRLRFEHGNVEVERRWLGVGRKRVFHATDIAAFLIRNTMQTGDKTFYNVEMLTHRGQVMAVAHYLGNRQQAEWLLEEMNCCLKKQL